MSFAAARIRRRDPDAIAAAAGTSNRKGRQDAVDGRRACGQIAAQSLNLTPEGAGAGAGLGLRGAGGSLSFDAVIASLQFCRVPRGNPRLARQSSPAEVRFQGTLVRRNRAHHTRVQSRIGHGTFRRVNMGGVSGP